MAGAPSLVDLLRRLYDPYGYAFGPPRPIYGYRPGWPYQALPRPSINPPTPPAQRTPLPPGWGSSGWAFGQGIGQPPQQNLPFPELGVLGLRNWIPPPPTRVRQ